MKKCLFVLRRPPHSGALAQEMLDAILMAAAFDQPVAVLLLDDAVFQIKRNQDPERAGMKNLAAVYSAFEIYDVKYVYAEMESLQERGLKPGDLSLPVQEVYRKDVAALMKRYDLIFSG